MPPVFRDRSLQPSKSSDGRPLAAPVAAVAAAAAASPERPFSFHRDGWDWRWASFGAAWRRVLWVVDQFPGGGAGERIGIPAALAGEAIALDLGLQAAGCAAVAIRADSRSAVTASLEATVEATGATALVVPAGAEVPSIAGVRKIELPLIATEQGIDRTGDVFPSLPSESTDGGAIVLDAGRSAFLGQETLAALARAVDAAVQRGGGEAATPRREIAVVAGPSLDFAERAFLAWAEAVGAALVLEPDPTLRAATAAWARPTVFCGRAVDIAELLSRAARAQRVPFRRGGLPFGRLRTVLATDALPDDLREGWSARGVVAGLLDVVELAQGRGG